jgi:hypothetical protein
MKPTPTPAPAALPVLGPKLTPRHPAADLPFKLPGSLLSIEADAKTAKGSASGHLTGILYLAPGTLAGVGNLCPHASPGCLAACLFTAGFAGVYESVNSVRVMRTRFLHDNRAGFLSMLRGEISALVRSAARRNMRPVVRLNGTSDLPWEKLAPDLFAEFPRVKFYDYTKNARRALAFAKGEMPANYHLTFSLSETNAPLAAMVIRAGVNVCAVAESPGGISKTTLPGDNLPRPTFDADRHDLRFLDRKGADGVGRIGLLKAKGKAKGDLSGFVIRNGGQS